MGYHYDRARPEPYLVADNGDVKMAAAIKLLEYVSEALEGKYNTALFNAFLREKEAVACVDELRRAVRSIEKGEQSDAQDSWKDLPALREVIFLGLKLHLDNFKLPNPD